MTEVKNSIIKVLVVDDSLVQREMLVHIYNSDPRFQVVGTANNGEEAIVAARRLDPDIISMDIIMPVMDGLEATRKIMETDPKPIVIVTASLDYRDVAVAMNSIEAGALAVIKKPKWIGHPEYGSDVAKLIETVKLMSEVKVVRRWITKPALYEIEIKPKHGAQIKLVAIGASIGGPPVIQTILSMLPKDFHASILIVQHIAEGFIEGFVTWLAGTSSLPVHIAKNFEYILPGHVYVAADGFQMKVSGGGRILLTNDEPESGLKPSVSCLFRSVADVYGKNAAGVLLTGMGKDGALELKLIKERGGITIAQDMESSVVHGMPGEAIRMGAAMFVLQPEKIAGMLSVLAKRGRE